MNIKTFHFFLLFNCLLQTQAYSNEKKMFSGSVHFPHRMTGDLCLFYNGEKVTVEQHSVLSTVQYSFLGDKNIHELYLIITDGLTCSTQQANTLQHLQIGPGHSYTCYKLVPKRNIDSDTNTATLTWDVYQYTLPGNIVPQNSLIFLFDPKLIYGLKIESWKSDNLFRIIPTIMINTESKIQEIKRAINIAQLAALDINAIHSKSDLFAANAITPAIITSMY